MITITNITPVKNEQAVLEITNQHKKETHIITMQFLYRHHLEIGMELTTTFYNELLKENEQEQLYNKALHYISYQMRTISEVKKHCRKFTNDEHLIQNIIDQLKQAQYLSDLRYAQEYVTEKIEFDIMGPIKIKEKLVQKGLHYDIIDAELLRYTREVEYAKMEDLIHKEIRYTIKKPYRKFIESLKRKAITKGFHLDVVDNAIMSFKEDIMAMIDDTDLLRKEFNFLSQKLDISNYDDRQKMIQKLLQKGFYYDRIKQLIEED